MKTKRILGGYYLSFGITLFFISFLIILPLFAIFSQVFTLSFDEFIYILTDDRNVSALKLTFLTAFIASIFNAIFGLLLAYILVKYDFFAKSFIDASIDLPFALPTAVAGLCLLTLYDTNFFLGQFLNFFQIEIPYSQTGIIIAMIFTSLPFGVRTVQPLLKSLNPNLEEAALTLGASHLSVFLKITFPQILFSFLKGFALAFSRSLGEFGAVLFIAGNILYETEVASLLIMTFLEEFDYASASVIALVILISSLFIMLSILIFEKYKKNS